MAAAAYCDRVRAPLGVLAARASIDGECEWPANPGETRTREIRRFLVWAPLYLGIMIFLFPLSPCSSHGYFPGTSATSQWNSNCRGREARRGGHDDGGDSLVVLPPGDATPHAAREASQLRRSFFKSDLGATTAMSRCEHSLKLSKKEVIAIGRPRALARENPAGIDAGERVGTTARRRSGASPRPDAYRVAARPAPPPPPTARRGLPSAHRAPRAPRQGRDERRDRKPRHAVQRAASGPGHSIGNRGAISNVPRWPGSTVLPHFGFEAAMVAALCLCSALAARDHRTGPRGCRFPRATVHAPAGPHFLSTPCGARRPTVGGRQPRRRRWWPGDANSRSYKTAAALPVGAVLQPEDLHIALNEGFRVLYAVFRVDRSPSLCSDGRLDILELLRDALRSSTPKSCPTLAEARTLRGNHVSWIARATAAGRRDTGVDRT
ncbi:hypothetical protein AURANDRAFT_67430 [Aureococcus anophagefferens]|uniref:Uncharacterized protein n=1 Tax=Aureococcus anophagefferens TaxID=44056 RepID=F0YL37_AURAN|nr:hypothetical protein AURANDRAFT_67430 [Aureococcus anophagefferens]EGB04182.1 hypothetical protein AURANDRAFT_67430 [Aureococcus anophagefferens]|eukprot:XP_009041167.1 hypothetical protein AURANDRAFT_67430 [Aureococcus anophagefferens]